MLVEEWRPVVGYEGIYQVSDLGRVRRILASKGARVGRILKPAHNRSTGYETVGLYTGGVVSHCYVHALVAEAFIGPRPADADVNHKNGRRADNIAANLEYLSRAGNMLHAHDVLGFDNSGEHNPQARLTESDVVCIRGMRARGAKLREIADIFDCSFQNVDRIVRGEAWAHVH